MKMHGKQGVAKLASRGTLAQANDQLEPPFHLCDGQIVNGEYYVRIKFVSDPNEYAVCFPCAKGACGRERWISPEDWRMRTTTVVQFDAH